jgi:hypothetical protein
MRPWLREFFGDALDAVLENDFGVTTRGRRSDKVSSIRLRSPGHVRQDVLTVVGESHSPRPLPDPAIPRTRAG